MHFDSLLVDMRGSWPTSTRRWRMSVWRCRRTPRRSSQTTAVGGVLSKVSLFLPQLTMRPYRYQKCIWDLMEHPESSSTANIVSFISMMFVIVSTIGMALNTMPGLKVATLQFTWLWHFYHHISKVLDAKGEAQNNPMLETIEAVCIAWFTMEYFLRWTFAVIGLCLNIID